MLVSLTVMVTPRLVHVEPGGSITLKLATGDGKDTSAPNTMRVRIEPKVETKTLDDIGPAHELGRSDSTAFCSIQSSPSPRAAKWTYELRPA